LIDGKPRARLQARRQSENIGGRDAEKDEFPIRVMGLSKKISILYGSTTQHMKRNRGADKKAGNKKGSPEGLPSLMPRTIALSAGYEDFLRPPSSA
jgi:hypothetical protein